jgi:hypothetical protein
MHADTFYQCEPFLSPPSYLISVSFPESPPHLPFPQDKEAEKEEEVDQLSDIAGGCKEQDSVYLHGCCTLVSPQILLRSAPRHSTNNGFPTLPSSPSHLNAVSVIRTIISFSQRSHMNRALYGLCTYYPVA